MTPTVPSSERSGTRAGGAFWARPLTPAEIKRIHLHLALIPVYAWLLVGWITYVADMGVTGRLDRSGHLKGHDFVHFYVQGQIAVERASVDLYDFKAHADRTDRLVPEYAHRFLPVHSPQVAMFFAPLALLSYLPALSVWLLLSVAVYAGCCLVLWRSLPHLREYPGVATLLAAGCPAFFSLVAAGQTSAFSLAWLTLAFLALRHDRPWLAGFAMGSLAYKPSLGLVLPVALLYARQYKVVAAAIAAVMLQFAVAWICFGGSALAAYLDNFRNVATFSSLLEAQPSLMHSLQSFFGILAPSRSVATAAYVLTAATTTIVAARVWASDRPLERRYAVLLIATVLVSPHLYAYDLVILVPAFMLIASCAIAQNDSRIHLWLLLYFAYYLPALGAIATHTRVQWSVLALVGLVVSVVRSRHTATTNSVSR